MTIVMNPILLQGGSAEPDITLGEYTKACTSTSSAGDIAYISWTSYTTGYTETSRIGTSSALIKYPRRLTGGNIQIRPSSSTRRYGTIEVDWTVLFKALIPNQAERVRLAGNAVSFALISHYNGTAGYGPSSLSSNTSHNFVTNVIGSVIASGDDVIYASGGAETFKTTIYYPSSFSQITVTPVSITVGGGGGGN